MLPSEGRFSGLKLDMAGLLEAIIGSYVLPQDLKQTLGSYPMWEKYI